MLTVDAFPRVLTGWPALASPFPPPARGNDKSAAVKTANGIPPVTDQEAMRVISRVGVSIDGVVPALFIRWDRDEADNLVAIVEDRFTGHRFAVALDPATRLPSQGRYVSE